MHESAAADDFAHFICCRCDKQFTEKSPYKGPQLSKGYEDDDYEDEEEALEFDDVSQPHSTSKNRSKQKMKSGPGTDAMGFEPSSAQSTWLDMSDNDPEIELVPSTKVAMLKSLLLKGFEEAPMDKVRSF